MEPYSDDDLQPLIAAIDRRRAVTKPYSASDWRTATAPESPVHEIRLKVSEAFTYGALAAYANDTYLRTKIHAYQFHLINYALSGLGERLGQRPDGNGGKWVDNFTNVDDLKLSAESAEAELKSVAGLSASKIKNLAEENVKLAIDTKIAELKEREQAGEFSKARKTKGPVSNEAFWSDLAGEDKPLQANSDSIAPKETAPTHITPHEMTDLELNDGQKDAAKGVINAAFDTHQLIQMVKQRAAVTDNPEKARKSEELLALLKSYRDAYADAKLKGQDITPGDEAHVSDIASDVRTKYAERPFIKDDKDGSTVIHVTKKIVKDGLLKALGPRLVEAGMRSSSQIKATPETEISPG